MILKWIDSLNNTITSIVINYGITKLNLNTNFINKIVTILTKPGKTQNLIARKLI